MAEYDPKRMRPQDLRDSTVRSLGDAVSGLANIVKNISGGTVKAVGKGVVGGASSSGFTPAKLLGVGAGAAIHPLIGSLVKQAVENQQPQMTMAMNNYMSSMKDTLIRNFKRQRDELSDLSQHETVQVKSRILRAKRRLQNDSYSAMYGSDNVVEAVDRLRVSNAEWIKALGTESSRILKSKPIPRAAAGGYVKESGEAFVHKGEVITPANMVRLQTQALININKQLQGTEEANEALQNISKVMGGVKVDILDSPLVDELFSKGFSKVLVSGLRMFNKMFAARRREKALSDTSSGRPAYFHYRAVQRATTLDTIAAATAATYAHVRVQGERQITLLQSISSALGSHTPDRVKGWGFKEIKEPSGIWEGIVRALTETGDLEDVMGPAFKAFGQTKIGGAISGFGSNVKSSISNRWNSMFGGAASPVQSPQFPPTNKIMPSIPMIKLAGAASGGDVTESGIARVHSGETIVPGQAMQTSINVQAASAKILSRIYKMMYRFFKRQEKKEKKEEQTIIKEGFIRRKLSAWLDDNKVDEVRDAVLATQGGGGGGFKSQLMAQLGASALGRGFFRGRKAGAGMGSSVWRGLRGAAMSSKKFRAGKAALGGMGTAALAGGSRLIGGAGKLVSGGMKAFGGLGKFAKIGAIAGVGGVAGAGIVGTALAAIGGPIGLAIMVITSLIDGIAAVFKTGKIFDMAFKDTTVTMRISAFIGGVIDGLWKLVQIPFNLLAKMSGSDFRLGSIVAPVAKAVHSVLEILEPVIANLVLTGKFLFKFNKLVIKNFLRFIAFWIVLPFNPEKAFGLIQKNWNDFLNFISEIPMYLFKLLVNSIKFNAKAYVLIFYKLPALLFRAIAKAIDFLGSLIFEYIPKFFTESVLGIMNLLISIPESIADIFKKGGTKESKSMIGKFIFGIVKDVLKSMWYITMSIPMALLKLWNKIYVKLPIMFAKYTMKLVWGIGVRLPMAIIDALWQAWKFFNVKLPRMIGNAILDGIIGFIKTAWDFIKAIPGKIKNWLIDKAVAFIQKAIDFSLWADNIVVGINNFVDGIVNSMMDFEKWATDLPILVQKFANKVVKWFFDLFDPAAKKKPSFFGILMKALWSTFVALVWKIPKALVMGVLKGILRLIIEVPFILFAVMKNSAKALFISLPKVIARLIWRAIRFFVISPIIMTFKIIGNILSAIPRIVMQMASSIPFIGGYISKWLGLGGKATATPGAFKEYQADSIVDMVQRVGVPDLANIPQTAAANATMGERAMIKNNSDNSTNLGKGIQESSAQQVAAVSTSTNTIINTTTAVTNAKQDPFSRSPLWTNMNDLSTGAAI